MSREPKVIVTSTSSNNEGNTPTPFFNKLTKAKRHCYNCDEICTQRATNVKDFFGWMWKINMMEKKQR